MQQENSDKIVTENS